MAGDLIIKKSVFINAAPASVWDALVNPQKIKQYLFGTEAVSDWKRQPHHLQRRIGRERNTGSRYYPTISSLKKFFNLLIESSMSGTQDKPKNCVTFTYELSQKENRTLLTLTQDNCKTEEDRKKHLE